MRGKSRPGKYFFVFVVVKGCSIFGVRQERDGKGTIKEVKEEEKKEANGGNEKAMQSGWCGGNRWETRMDRKRIKRDDSKEEKWDEATKQDQKRQ